MGTAVDIETLKQRKRPFDSNIRNRNALLRVAL